MERGSGDAARRTRLRLASDCLLAVIIAAGMVMGILGQGEVFYLVMLGLLLIGVIRDIVRGRTELRSMSSEQGEPPVVVADPTG